MDNWTQDKVRTIQPDLDDNEVTALSALANFLTLDADDIESAAVSDGGVYGYGYLIEVDGEEYAVCTNDEANSAWDDALDYYLDECILPELPELLKSYFDRDAWKRDTRHDGRGPCLSCYDGNENEQDGFYIYRTN